MAQSEEVEDSSAVRLVAMEKLCVLVLKQWAEQWRNIVTGKGLLADC